MRGDEGRRYAADACEALESCGCVSHFDSRSSCQSTLEARFELARDVGLSLDLDCFEASLASMARCDPVPLTYEPPACFVLHGDKREGDYCSRRADLPGLDVGECRVGLTCRDRRCVPEGADVGFPAPPEDPGTECDPTTPVACGVGSVYCGAGDTCASVAGLGEACDHALGCEFIDEVADVYLFCRGVHGPGDIGVCTGAIPTGAPCDPLDYAPCESAGRCDPDLKVCTDESASVHFCREAEFYVAWPHHAE